MASVNTPYFPQLEERDCGATCLRMVLAHHGLDVPMERLRALSGTDERGTDLAGLARAAEALGLDAVAADLSFDELLAPDLWPAILHWDGNHFVVVTEVAPDRVVLLDPALGERRLDRETFEGHRLGTGRSRTGLIVLQPRDARRTELPNVGDLTAPPPAPAPPLAIWAASLLYGGVLAAALYALLRVLRLSVDLQFHETWLRNLGVLLLVLAAAILGRYLVRRTAIQYAQAAGELDVEALARRIGLDARSPARAGDTTLATRLMEDVDTVRIWRAYSLGVVFTASVTVLAAMAFAFGVDAVYGLGLTAAVIVVGLGAFYVAVAAPGVTQRALGAQAAQREAIVEYARVLPESLRLGQPASWLDARLRTRSAAAAGAFEKLTAEVIARADLKLTLGMVCAVLLLSLALYRLGYAGLQVGDALFLVVLVWLVFGQLRAVATAYQAYGRTADARARLGELRAERPLPGPTRSLAGVETLRLSWGGGLGNEQAFEFGTTSRLALAGSDDGLRRMLVGACLGRENVLGARLTTVYDEPATVQLPQLGRVAYLSGESALVAGTVAQNITLSEEVDYTRLDRIAAALDLKDGDLPEGLATRIDERGSQLTHLTFVKTIVARALYAGAEVLIIDGLTDGLPAYQEALILDELLATADGKLVICNARRLSATYGFDAIVQLEAGEIEGFGTHDALATGGGAYALQFATQRGIER